MIYACKKKECGVRYGTHFCFMVLASDYGGIQHALRFDREGGCSPVPIAEFVAPSYDKAMHVSHFLAGHYPWQLEIKNEPHLEVVSSEGQG